MPFVALILPVFYAAICSGLFIHDSPCRTIYFNITTSALNRVANNPPSDLYSDPEAVSAFLDQPVAYQTVSGTFRIHGQLCSPRRRTSKLQLQVLVHGVTYNHTYWAGLAPSPNAPSARRYSWIQHALSQGYHTLAIDRLGSGASDHPDPVNLVQDPLQVEVLHELLVSIRRNDVLGLAFAAHDGQIVYVGHSYGSGLGVHLARKYPDAVDALLLTGIAVVGGNPGPGSTMHRWAQAADAFPDRFSATVFAPGYLVSTNRSGRRDNFYSLPGRDFDPATYDRDWRGEGTISLGEQLTVAEYLVELPDNFTKPVFVATGSEDAIFCSEYGSRALGPVDCGTEKSGLVADTRKWFAGVPDEKFKVFVQPHSGHCHHLHYTARDLFKEAHEWLGKMC